MEAAAAAASPPGAMISYVNLINGSSVDLDSCLAAGRGTLSLSLISLSIYTSMLCYAMLHEQLAQLDGYIYLQLSRHQD